MPYNFTFPLNNAASASRPAHPISWMNSMAVTPNELCFLYLCNQSPCRGALSNMMLLWGYEEANHDVTFVPA